MFYPIEKAAPCKDIRGFILLSDLCSEGPGLGSWQLSPLKSLWFTEDGQRSLFQLPPQPAPKQEKSPQEDLPPPRS